MTEVIAMSLGVKIFTVFTAFLFSWFVLRCLDGATRFDFSGWLNNASDTSIGIYLGSRILAVCILAGLVLS